MTASMSVGMPTMRASATRSPLVVRRSLPAERPDLGGRAVPAEVAEMVAIGSAVELLGLGFQVLAGRGHILVLDELLERRDRRVVGECRVGVPVQELRDRLRAADELGRLLLQRV